MYDLSGVAESTDGQADGYHGDYLLTKLSLKLIIIRLAIFMYITLGRLSRVRLDRC